MNLSFTLPRGGGARLRSGIPAFGNFLLSLIPYLGMALICIVAPALYVDVCQEPWVTPKMMVVAFGAFVLWAHVVISLREAQDHVVQRTKIAPALAAFFVCLLASTLVSLDAPISVFGQFKGQFHGLVPMALYALIYIASSRSRLKSNSVINMTLVGSLIINGWAICQKTEWFPALGQYLGWGMQSGRAGSTFGSPIFLGAFISLVVPLAYAWATDAAKARRCLGFAALFLAFGAAVAARARGGLAAGFAAMLIFEYMRGEKSSAIQSACFAVLLLGLFHDKTMSLKSDLGRLEIWRAALVGWRHHPIFGSGPDTFGLLYNRYVRDNIVQLYGSSEFIQISAHNDLLQVLATMGIVGLAAYLLLTLRVFSMLRRREAAVICAVVSVLLQAKVQAIHLCVIAICAALVGTQDRFYFVVPALSEKEADSAAYRRFGVAVLGLAFAFGIVRIAQRQTRATVYERIAVLQKSAGRTMSAIAFFNKAAVENPYQIHYIQRELDALWAIIDHVDKEQAKHISAVSMQTADYTTKLHPNDPTAHDIRALALKTLTMTFGLDTLKESKTEMDEASRLAPTSKSYIRDARAIAEQSKDAFEFRKRTDELDHISNLEKSL